MPTNIEINRNLENLISNEYPGRGFVIGTTPNGEWDVVMYWLMGRSKSSRGRFLQIDHKTGDVHVRAYDPSKIKNPRLELYTAIREWSASWNLTDQLGHEWTADHRIQIVSNGRQTNAVYNFLERGDEQDEHFIQLDLRRWTFEPDAPNYTPRVTGILVQRGDGYGFSHSWRNTEIIKRSQNGRRISLWNLDDQYQGLGVMVHTYEGNGNPLPSFKGRPREVLIHANKVSALGDTWWDLLNGDNKVALVVKGVKRGSSLTNWALYNRLGNQLERYYKVDE